MAELAVRHGASSSKVRLVPLPVPSVPTVPVVHSVPTVLCLSRVTRLKGIAELLAAFSLLSRDARLLIANDGNDVARIRALVRAHPRRGRIELLGAVPTERVSQLLAEADVVALPSLWPEPFGLVGIEALAAGKPVVASGTGGMNEWARPELGVIVAVPNDARSFAAALERALAEPQWVDRARTVGRDHVSRHHSLPAHDAALVAAFEN
ncbi:MAG TPA: glycosyltransferase [Gemmatimonadales bacterium]|nr:glycosyltransferase [Gemmatimonadales bacterium]